MAELKPGAQVGRGGRRLSDAAILRPLGTLALTSVAVVLGLYFINRLPVNLLPAIEYPMVTVTINYPGASPEVVEEQITRVLERSLSATENLAGISSRASEGRTNVNLRFDYGVDLDLAMQNAARLLEQARQQLPPDIEPPRLRKWDPGEWPIWRAGLVARTQPQRGTRLGRAALAATAADLGRGGHRSGRRWADSRGVGGAESGPLAPLWPFAAGRGRTTGGRECQRGCWSRDLTRL